MSCFELHIWEPQVTTEFDEDSPQGREMIEIHNVLCFA